MISDQLLRQDIRMLGEMLGDTIREQAGDTIFDHVEQVRALAKNRRAGEAGSESAMGKLLSDLPLSELRAVARSFSIFFELANLAEDRQRVRVLRDREREQEPEPRSESIAAAVRKLSEEGWSAQKMQEGLNRLTIELVFTAHPTEAKRRSLRAKVRLIRNALEELDRPNLLQRERRRAEAMIRAALTGVWQMDFLNPRRPTVIEEVRRALNLMKSLWDVVPMLYVDLRAELEQCYPGHEFTLPPFLRFGSWIGGDRDGNPYCTNDVTERTLGILRNWALDRHIEQCEQAGRLMTPSSQNVQVSQALVDEVKKAVEKWPAVARRLSPLSEFEHYRRWLFVIQWRLQRSRQGKLFGDLPSGAYANVQELRRDLELMRESLRENGGDRIFEADLEAWLIQVDVFGFHTACLDVRQESSVYKSVIDEALKQQGVSDDYASLPEEDKQKTLIESMPAKGLDLKALSKDSADTFNMFRLLARAHKHLGHRAMGGHIISMTHEPSDVLAVLWFAQWASAEEGIDPSLALGMPIIPLFETIDDLARAASTMEAILDQPTYAETLRGLGGVQTVMVGYSDSTKDGGYLAACWAQYQAQAGLHEVTESRGFDLMIFHGRGGSLGRGGGPAARSILSLPPHTVDGRVRITEQGEVLAERYDDPQVAYRHLEQVTWATMLVSAIEPEPVDEKSLDAMKELAEHAWSAYRHLVEQDAFIAYFREATPIAPIESMPIGSRPSRRRKTKSLSDLRAIPWVFAWTQSRQLLPAWYGLGGAIQAYVDAHNDGEAQLQAMYKSWPFFRATVQNAELALAKADMSIAHWYAQLTEDQKQGHALFNLIRHEHTRTSEWVLKITGHESLLGSIGWLQRSIDVRNPYVDPLNLMQVQLLRRWRETAKTKPDKQEQEEINSLLRLTIQGIAAGMRTTG